MEELIKIEKNGSFSMKQDHDNDYNLPAITFICGVEPDN